MKLEESMHIKISVWTSLKISLLHHHALHTSAGWSNRNAIHQLAAGCRPPLSSSPKYCRSASASRSAEPTWGPGHPDGQTWNPEQGLRDLFFFLVFIHALLELTCFTPNWVETVWHALGEWCFQSSVRGNIFSLWYFICIAQYLHCFSLFLSVLLPIFWSQADHYSYTVLVEQSIDPLLSRNQKFVKRASSSEWNRQVSCLIALLWVSPHSISIIQEICCFARKCV